MVEQHLGIGIAGQEMFGHIGEIECRTLLARDGGEVVALGDDENIIFVAGRESPGLAQLFSDIQAGAFPVLAGTVARPLGGRGQLPFGPLAQQ